MRIFKKSFLLSVAFLFCFAATAHALDVTLQWDANTEPNLAGYKIYYDTDPGAPYNGTGAQEGNSPIDIPLAQDENPDPDVVEYTVHNLPDGTYYFAATAYDNSVPPLESGYSNEVDTTTPDTTPPVISNVQVSSVTDTTAVIQWTTDEASDSQVQYGATSSTWGSYPSSKIDLGMVTNHSVTLTGLNDNMTYYFRVGSTDGSGNGPTTSSEMNFTTDITPDTTSPSIVGYPTINYAADTIDVTYSESNMQNPTTEANYTFSPSLNFETPSVEGDDITNPSGNTYRLNMASIPNNTILTLTVSNITDQEGNPVAPSTVKINDNDNDGMADDWENTYGIGNPATDPDSDGLNNFQEYDNNTNPNNSDTDGDTLPDGWEVTYGLDPNDSTGANGPDGDVDNDGWTNYEEFTMSTDPGSDTSPPPTPPIIKKTIPRNNSGILNNKRVPTNTSFAVLFHDLDGIDITDTSSIKFTINDHANDPYTRDLTDSAVFRVVKLSSDPDTQVTKLWAVYDRSLDTYGNFAYDSNVNIQVDAKDRRGDAMAQASFDFNIESPEEHDDALTSSPDTTTRTDVPSVGLTTISIEIGDLAGTKIVYDSNEPIKPEFGPPHEVPTIDAQGVEAVYYPLNLQPPTVFNNPVKIFIPVRDVEDVGDLYVGYYDGSWMLVCDTDGNVLPDGEGWMVPGSRVNYNCPDPFSPEGAPSHIELQVYHFSAVQAAFLSDIGSGSGSDGVGGEGGGGGCFVATAGSSSKMDRHAKEALMFLLIFVLAGVMVTIWRRRGTE